MEQVTNAQSLELPNPDSDLSLEDVLKIVMIAIDNKKGFNPIALDVSKSVDYLDYMVVCTGQTAIHNRAIADAVVSELDRYDIIPDGLHGHRHGDWILVDFGVLVVHVFLPDLRDFYRLEELWGDGSVVELKT